MKEDLQAKIVIKCPRCGFLMYLKHKIEEDFSLPQVPIGYACMNCYAFRKEVEYEAKQVGENEI